MSLPFLSSQMVFVSWSSVALSAAKAATACVADAWQPDAVHAPQ